MIRNVIFDMGGVIVDIHLERAINNFKSIGVHDADRLIDAYHHKGLFIAIENGDIDADEFCRRLSEHAGKEIPREAIEQAWRSIIDPPPAYRLQFLEELRRTHKVCMLTNNNPIIMEWDRARTLTGYFDKIYVSYKMKCVKPDPRIYLMMLEDGAMLPDESLFIDDSEKNLEGARRCGLHTYLAKNGEDWREDVMRLLA